MASIVATSLVWISSYSAFIVIVVIGVVDLQGLGAHIGGHKGGSIFHVNCIYQLVGMSAPPVGPPGDDSEGEVEPAMDDAAPMSGKARTAEKQARIEAALKSLPKGSKAYEDIVEGLRKGSFRKSRSNREKARSLLTKEKSRLTVRLSTPGKSKQVKGNEAKLGRVDKLLPLLDSETNVEENSDSAPSDSPPSDTPIDAKPYQQLPYYPGFFEPQEGAGCGRHALNNLFHNTYFVKEGAPIVDPSTLIPPIPLNSLCEFLARNNTATTKNGDNTIICKSNEDYEAEMLIAGLNVAGHKAERINDKDIYENGAYKEDTADNVLGYIVNSGDVKIKGDTMNHWTALRKVPNEDDQFEFIDSVGGPPDRLRYSSLIDYLKKYDIAASNRWKAVLRVENHTEYIDPLVKIREIAAAANEQRKQAAAFKAAKKSVKDAVSALGLTDRKLKRKLKEARKHVESTEQAIQLASVLTAERIRGKEERIKEIVSTSSASVASQIIELVGTGRTSIATGVPLTTATVPILPPKVSAVPVPAITAPIAVATASTAPVNILHAEEEKGGPGPCAELFDPCTREPIENGDIAILEKRVRDIKKQRQLAIQDTTVFPADIITRLDLLLFILNRPEKPNEGLLQYNINGQLYEAYWDIVFTLGRIGKFPITKEFYMYNGDIAKLNNINGEGFINSPLTYLSSRKVNLGASGASDITFVYKKQRTVVDADECSSDPSVLVTSTCKKGAEGPKIVDSERPKFFFCSSKFFKKDASKGVDKFDIQNIYTAAKSLTQEYDRQIILLVKDAGAVKETLRKAIRKYMSDEVSKEYVYGMTELFAALTSLYDYIQSNRVSSGPITRDHLISMLSLESPPKPILSLRLHQYIATYKICDAIESFKRTGGSNKFLVGIVPRGGKTFIAGGIIDQLKPKRVVVLLGAKSETLSQFKKDLFEEFQNFQEYECVDVVDADFTKAIDPAKRYIFIMSVELWVRPKADSDRKLLKDLKGGARRADLFICDEAHLKQTTSKAGAAMVEGTVGGVEEEDVPEDQETAQLATLDKQILADVPVVYMTGTYIKPKTALKIPDDNVVIWDYQDIQQAKELSTNEPYFKDIYGELYDRALATCLSYGQTYETIQAQYQKFPELYLLSTQFTEDAKNAFLKQEKGGFPTITHLFEIRRDFNPETTAPELWYSGFVNPKGILRLLNYLAPPTQQLKAVGDVDPIDPISSVLKSVDIIAQRIGDRLGFFTSEFVTHSQLWFLPHMQKNPLYKRMCALAGAIFQLPWFRKYFHIVAVSSSVKWNIPGSENNSILIRAADRSDSCGKFSWYVSPCPTGKNDEKSLKQCLIDQEELARKKGKGLIILAQNMLHLGISLPCVDIVVLLDAGEKVDERIQKMYRALTESTNKKGGYIIDMNYFRTVTAIMNYQITAETSRKKGKKGIYSSDIPTLFNKVLDIFSIDIDKPIYGTSIEDRTSGNTPIQKATLPELEKILPLGGKKTGDSIMLEDAGKVLNARISEVLKAGYSRSYDDFLGKMREEEEKKRLLREEGVNVTAAEHEHDEEEEGAGAGKGPSYPTPVLFSDKATEEQKREAYLDMFKTALKLGAFGTNSANVFTLETKLGSDEDLRQILYDTLLKRGSIIEDTVTPDLQRDRIIDFLIRPGLTKMLADGRNAPYTAMKELIDNDEKYPAQVEKVLEYIKEHLTPKSAERDKFGEVFTPMALVNEMLDTLPADIWNKKDLKWLDPANGMGNFPIGVFLRLFYGFRTKAGKYIGIKEEGEGDYNPGLTKVIPDEEARRKHIVQKMLYMVELNSKNIAVSKLLFKKLAPSVEPNIIQMHRVNGFLADVDMKFPIPNGTVNEFDIVMGNPPFQGGARKSVGTRKVTERRLEEGIDVGKNKNLWVPFIEKILSKHLKPNGYMIIIHPVGWFKTYGPFEDIHNVILDKQLITLKNFKDSQLKEKFGESANITSAYYLLQNKPSTVKTTVIDVNGIVSDIKLNKKYPIVLAYNNILYKIIDKCELFKDTKQYAQKSLNNSECSDSGTNKNIAGIDETGNILTVKSMKKHPYQDTPKIFIDGSSKLKYYYDKDGKYGIIGQNQFYIIGDELEDIEKYFKTKLANFLLRTIKYRMNFIEPRYYPDIRTIKLEKINDDTLADYFKFTKEERDVINATETPHDKYKFTPITCTELSKKKDSEETPCPPDEERHPVTKRCTKKCIPPKIRSEKGTCVNPPSAKSKRAPTRTGGGHRTRRQR